MVESFFATRKTKLIQGDHTQRDATTESFEYLEGVYNRSRHQSTLDYLALVELEQRAAQNI